jgi:hypothetical protein
MSGIQFDSDLPADDLGTCERFVEDCGVSEDYGLNGPITCERASQSASGQYCNATIACKQAGTLGDADVQIYGYLSTDCQPLGDGWNCTCSTGSATASITVEAESGWDACTISAERCPDEVDVVIGEQYFGRPVFPGVPFL